MGLHGIAASRLKKKVLNFDSNIADKRGKHANHPKISEDIRNLVREHIRKFPARESPYSRLKNEHKKYLDSSLSIAQMHRMFVSENPAFARTVQYWLYQNIFNYDFNISIGFPRSDICDKCELQQVNIKAAEIAGDDAQVRKLKAEHELHIRKADVFNVQMREATETAKAMGDACDTAVIANCHGL